MLLVHIDSFVLYIKAHHTSARWYLFHPPTISDVPKPEGETVYWITNQVNTDIILAMFSDNGLTLSMTHEARLKTRLQKIPASVEIHKNALAEPWQ